MCDITAPQTNPSGAMSREVASVDGEENVRLFQKKRKKITKLLFGTFQCFWTSPTLRSSPLGAPAPWGTRETQWTEIP